MFLNTFQAGEGEIQFPSRKAGFRQENGSSFTETGRGGGEYMGTVPRDKDSRTVSSDCFYFPSETGSKESAASEDMEVV